MQPSPLKWGSYVSDQLYWPVVSSNNPLPVHNVSMTLLSKFTGELTKYPLTAKFQVIPNQNSLPTVSQEESDEQFERKGAWREGAQILPEYTEYGVMMKLSPRYMVQYMVLPTWQRILLFKELLKYTAGLLILLLLVCGGKVQLGGGGHYTSQLV